MSNAGDNAQNRAAAGTSPKLEWQSELDHALADIDTRLTHPRRRASDLGVKPELPELGGEVNITSELLDEIAWRVSEQLRRQQPTLASEVADAPMDFHSDRLAAPLTASVKSAPIDFHSDLLAPPIPPPVMAPQEPKMPAGVAIVIRFRWPLFGRRRRPRGMTNLNDSRIT
jgi:hypothetical protein